VGTLAFLIRGLHLDGLADLADGLGASRTPTDTLAVMHRSDIGAFGVVAVVVALMLQVSALALLSEAGSGMLGILIALPAGRLAVIWLSRADVAAAPGSTLGAWVAGSVPTRSAVAATVGWLAAAVTAGFLAHPTDWLGAIAAGAAVGVAVMTALLWGRIASGRLAGITGDVLGAAVETAQTAALLALALALG
jgi:adenosylcobinamide-GDP ribazoletransferase